MTRKKKPTIEQTLEELKAALNKEGYELILRKKPTKDIVAFDFGLIFTKDSNEVQIYVDDVLKEVITQLTITNGQVLLKANYFSPDVVLITAAENPDPLRNATEAL